MRYAMSRKRLRDLARKVARKVAWVVFLFALVTTTLYVFDLMNADQDQIRMKRRVMNGWGT